MKKILVGLLPFFLLLTSLDGSAQISIKKFTHDSTKFLEEMTTVLTESRKKEGKEMIEAFTPVWYGGNFTSKEREEVYAICDVMLKKRMRPFPDFKSYLTTLVGFVNTKQPRSSFTAWQTSLEKLIGGRTKRQFSEYLLFCNNLFSENSIYKSLTTTWNSSSGQYSFEIEEGEPVIRFDENMNLRCYAKKDSAVIWGTKGVYYPLKKIWKGAGGKVTWERAGFTKDQVYAELKNYRVETKKSTYKADSVTFYNNIYFDKPLGGVLRERVLANVKAEKANYPQFDSYSKRLKITNIIKGIDYDGGFSQYGPKFIGKGTDEQNANLIFKRKDKAFLIASSKEFTIRTDRISSATSSIKIYLEQDSITHPGLKFRLNIEKRLLTLLRTDEGVSQSPYFNSYHKVDMYFEVLYWEIDNPVIEMGPLTGSTNKSATFESDNYFKSYRFDKILGLETVHPLVRIKDCAKYYDRDVLSTAEISQFMKKSQNTVRPLLMTLSNMGFLEYNYVTNEVTVKERLYHYILAKSEKKDYDVIQINSNLTRKDKKNTNASLNLLNFDLTIRGVQRFTLSDSHQVNIFPIRRTIVMKKNRDIAFSGIINAGKLEFFGKEYYFTYDDFDIDMPNVDSLRLRVETGKLDERGRKRQVRVKTVIENITGTMEIDEAGNKSGLKDKPEYPIFRSLKESYAFYDRPSIQNNIYQRDNFYFQLEPFVFDSLDNFRNEGIRFEGSFTSAGIFPDFEETLTLQPDYSLGFVRPTPKAGFEVYGGKGVYKKDINLSHEGLRGDGILKYLTSTSVSNDFLFFPDSVNAICQNYVIEEQLGDVEYPPVTGTDVGMHWEPYRDKMEVESREVPIVFYDGNSNLQGDMTLNPKELNGSGLFSFEEAEMDSELFKFKFKEFFADTADFRLKSDVPSIEQLSFKTNNVNAHIDFAERKGVFVSNGGGSYVDFPINQYIAYMDRFTWFMDDAQIELSAGKDKKRQGANELAFEGSRFISTHPKQDSLDFYSVAARYDLAKHIIYAKKVEFISVADALVYPRDGNVVIEKKATMRTLDTCQVVANSITKYHKIYNANVNIFAKRNYSGSGYYDYIDENKLKQTIFFSTLTVDTTIQTYGTGTITEEDAFTLSPFFDYKGEVLLSASNKFLEFSGTTRIHHECEPVGNNWMKFTAEIDPEEIYIPIDTNLLDENSNPLTTSVMLNKDSAHIYSAFLTNPKKKSDKLVLPANGFMVYDKTMKEYRISNISKLNERNLPGNYLSLSTEACSIYGEGKLDFGTDFGRIEMMPVGTVKHDLTSNDVAFETMILIEFFFANNALEKMAKAMESYDGLDAVSFDRPLFEKGMYELLEKKEANSLISKIALSGPPKNPPKELNKTMFLNDVKLKWNPDTRSYQSTGKIGIGNIYKDQVNRMVEGNIELIKKRGGDVLNIYFELDGKNWYFFSYSRFVMQAISSDEEFNNIIKETKPDKRKLKQEKGKPQYSYMPSSKRKKTDFQRRFADK